MALDFITEFKKLCVQLQKEDVIVYYDQARKMNDMDQELQELIGKFNLAKFNLNIEMNKKPDEQNEEELNRLDAELNDLYDQIMNNDSMVAFNEAALDVERLTKHVQAILTATVNGNDPMAVELPEEGCSGNCSSCSGCH